MSYKDENGRCPHMNLTCNLEINNSVMQWLFIPLSKRNFFILQDMEELTTDEFYFVRYNVT
jgi:hypothetical protein